MSRMTRSDEAAAHSLPAHLRHKAGAMHAAAESMPLVADWDEVVSAECVADDLTGVRKVRVRDWRYISDGGAPIGGFDLGPTSPESLCGVIASCLTHTYLCLAAARGIELDRVAVRVSAHNNDARFFGLESDRPPCPYGLRVEVDLRSGALTSTDLEAFVEEGHHTCPILHLLRVGAEIELATMGCGDDD